MPDDRRVVLVTGASTTIGRAVVSRLTADGFDVHLGPDHLDPDHLGSHTGALDVAVYAAYERDALTPRPLAEIDDVTFEHWCERPIRDFLQWLQAVHPRVKERNGTVVLVAPTTSQEGAAALVPYTTSIEGQRLLAKSAARQWASEGVAVLVVAPRLDAMVDDPSWLEASDALRTAPALDAPSRGAVAVADVLAMLLASGSGALPLTGSTVAVDGGALMAP